jgi:hypothetical protein
MQICPACGCQILLLSVGTRGHNYQQGNALRMVEVGTMQSHASQCPGLERVGNGYRRIHRGIVAFSS